MGEKWDHILMGEVLEQVVKASGWKKGGKKKNRGWGMAFYERGTPEGKASAAITLEKEGTVNILTGVPDVGPGYYTICQQMVCETLGLRPEQVAVSFKETDSLPLDHGTGGSKQNNNSDKAIYQTSREVPQKIIIFATRQVRCVVGELD